VFISNCCPGAEIPDADEQGACNLLNAVVGCLHKCLLYNREDKDKAHDVGGLFTIDCMKMLMSPLVDQVTPTLLLSIISCNVVIRSSLDLANCYCEFRKQHYSLNLVKLCTCLYYRSW